MRPLKSGGPLRGGYSATTLVCLCCISFLGGRFLRELPALPATPTGVRFVCCATLRYTALYVIAAAHCPRCQQRLSLPQRSSLAAPLAQLPKVVHTAKTSLRRSAVEIQKQADQAQQQQQQPDEQADSSRPVDSVAKPAALRTFEEAVTASGLLADKPPVAPGETGASTYLVQPTQLLSWYPRHAILAGVSLRGWLADTLQN